MLYKSLNQNFKSNSIIKYNKINNVSIDFNNYLNNSNEINSLRITTKSILFVKPSYCFEL